MTKPYLRFREDVAWFQSEFFSETCTEKCFTGRTSACCGREGIATFFADVVINLLLSTSEEIETLEKTIIKDQESLKCVYLEKSGCLWRLKPIVCEMFLCEHAKVPVLGKNRALLDQWQGLRRQDKSFTWPDKSVLFDEIEAIFLNLGIESPLMYFHRSPGLLRVKSQSKKRRKNDKIPPCSS